MGDNMCEGQYSNHNNTVQQDHNKAGSASAAAGLATQVKPQGTDQPHTAPPDIDDNAPLTAGFLRQELMRQHQLTLTAVSQQTALVLQEQLLPRDYLTTNIATKINVHRAALMELMSNMSELNSNKGGTHLKEGVDRLERQLVDYSFLLEGLERNDDIPLEMMVVNLIHANFGFNVEPRDIDLTVRFGSVAKNHVRCL